MLGVSNNHVMKGKRQGKKNKKEIKVTYISSPMKVKTSASNFRALVQELTGQDSNVAETFVEANGAYGVQKGSNQGWNSEAYFPESTTDWFKPDYSELNSGSSMESWNEQLHCDFFSFDMM
ncbi:uncharacterized protein LOC130748430 [Lotus japonicus]|uniref:uncharacterized protein LOC130748430 n=1 Tax=Lotus japonicus TaxID=34305 RepID=UPI00258843EC|nr:uncharacterized protein LOC130748430 [Lotus japonicus]